MGAIRDMLVREFAQEMSTISMELLMAGDHELVGYLMNSALHRTPDGLPENIEEFASMAADGFEVP